MNSSTSPSSFHAAHKPPGALAPFGDHLRHWRQHRRLSQQGLALEAEISTRHLSYVETGRAQPSHEMVLRLAERLSVPLRERNALLVAAGFTPMYQARPLDHPDLAAARQAVELVLKGHEPSPALAVDRHWNLVATNAVVPLLLDGVAPWLLEPPVNVLRLSLHPEGLGPRLANSAQWRAHLLHRLQQQIAATADSELQALHDEIAAYPFAEDKDSPLPSPIAVPFELHTHLGTLSFISTITIFGTPVDVTLQELAVESFFPADAETQRALQRLQARRRA
ncbi:helix-turn-helix transcriptional regulator [Comamonas thiooxydans]|uniref:Helix-turn-helix transcriptional regulator n=1 Tax=Comamonas thiooxydans TaxID=363952 RepID=A0AA42Q3P9_9BURK|nr:helix-turn-helix transcriptional regulator [Comamonas thiooxydans]MDH1335594.1 helix-turn-helix transcriptional regulator [Comamonas thiooxydans]MDH1743131.1 helix-turn-helix transcriptional regulator [Comamonas thiooxydans]MDH1788061.1 helix-turn-helix transcriptional regulator [Comamonas thiooxydans]